MLNPNILLSGRSPNVMNALMQGAQAADAQNSVMRQNRLSELFQEQGPGIMAGDPSALNAYAQMDPNAALGVKQTHQGMAESAERLRMAREAGRRAAEAHSMNLSAAEAAKEAETIQRAVSGGLVAAEQGQEALDAYLQSVDPDLVGQLTVENIQLKAAELLGVKDALEMMKGPEQTTGMQTLHQRAVAAGLQEGTPEYQQFMLQGGKQPESMSFEVGPEGGVTFSTGTGQAKLPKTTEGEKSAAGYLSRMKAAEKGMEELAGDGTAVRSIASLLVGGTNWEGLVLTEPQQRILQYQRDWVRAKLRKESGAVIGPEEMAEEIRTYFPLPGEGPKQVEQKRQSRLQAERQMEIMGGAASPQANPQDGEKRQITLDMVQSETPPDFVSDVDRQIWDVLDPNERKTILESYK